MTSGGVIMLQAMHGEVGMLHWDLHLQSQEQSLLFIGEAERVPAGALLLETKDKQQWPPQLVHLQAQNSSHIEWLVSKDELSYSSH